MSIDHRRDSIAALILDAREKPHLYRLSDDTRAWLQLQVQTLTGQGPIWAAAGRALTLDEEARRSQRSSQRSEVRDQRSENA